MYMYLFNVLFLLYVLGENKKLKNPAQHIKWVNFHPYQW